MHREVEALEAALNARRRQFVREAHKEDVNRVFRDLREDKPKPVQCLVRRTHYEVVEVSEQSITTRPEVAPSHRTLVHPEGQLKVAKHDGPRIQPSHPIDIRKGDSLVHELDIGEVSQVMNEFASEWAKRWDRHRHTPEAQWKPVLDFISSSLAGGEPMSEAPITIEQWMHAVHQKKRSAATGPDGLSRADMVAMPISLHRCLVKLVNAIETDPNAPWPEQWLEGHVFALEKVEGAQEVGAFRPITIFSIAYRTWSSLRSKQLLRHLCQFAAATCFGNLPRRHTAQVWWMLQETLEHASHNAMNLSGAVMDVVKAFNHLPRMVLLETACRLSVAPGLIRGWAKALTCLSRRFVCRGCAGEPQMSTTGFPEGCGLSVCAMLLANIVGHTWSEVHEPRAAFISYVDNYEVVTADADSTLQAMKAIHDFASLMDIQIDEAKTFAWANDPLARAELRGQGLDVKGAARELGGHLQYTRAFTNFTLQKRLSRMPMVWTRMARSSAGYWRKLKAIRAKAWPSALHGAKTIELGIKHFNQLLTGALCGLGVHKLGASPVGHMSLLERPDADPYCYLLLRMLSMFRAEQKPESTWPILDDLSSGEHPQWRAGPCSVLLKRMRDLGWTWTGHGNWRDDQGLPCRLFDCPIQELRERVSRSWQAKVQLKLRRRKTFQDIEDSCPQLSTGQLQLWCADEQGILRAVMNGTFYTQDKHQGQSNQCRFCGHTPDGQFHRVWECPVFAPQRSACVEEVRARVPRLPLSLTVHGWVPRPRAYHDLKDALLRVPDLTDHVEHLGEFPMPSQSSSELHLFLDGGCLHPQCHLSRLAAWAITAPSEKDPWTFVPLAAGVTPGWHQSAARGELMAAVAALRVVNHMQRPACLWSDNARVVRGLELLRQGGDHFNHNRKDADLWATLFRLMQCSSTLVKGVYKVASHQKVDATTSVAERWVFSGNNAADELVEQTLRETPECKQLRGHIHATIVRVGKQAVLLGRRQVKRRRGHSMTLQSRSTSGPNSSCRMFKNGSWSVAVEDVPPGASAVEGHAVQPFASQVQLFARYLRSVSLRVSVP